MPESVTLEEVQAATKRSLHFLCTQFLGYADWDGVHDDLEVFLNRPSRRKLILLPRGHLKSSIVTKGASIKSLLVNPNIRILIASEVWTNSRKMLFEIKEFLKDKSQLPKLFGNFEGSFREDDLTIQQRTRALSSPTIMTTGSEAEITSTHFDLIIADDLMGEQNWRTRESREKVKRFYRSLTDLLEPDGTLIVIGTRWHKDDLYADIIEKEAAYYDIMIRRVVEHGKTIFPKKFNKRFNPVSKSWEATEEPCLDFIKFLQETKPRDEFATQYMNEPMDVEDALIRQEYFKTYDRPPERLYTSLTIDPALSEKEENDPSAINVSGMDEKYDIYVLDSVKGRWKPSDLIDQIFLKVLQWKPQQVSLETAAFQKTLKYALEDEMRKRKVYFPITELKRGGYGSSSKFERIKALEPCYRRGIIYHAKWMKDLENELLDFPKGRHDDLADAMAMQLEVLVPGAHEPTASIPAYSWEWYARDSRRYFRGNDFFHEGGRR